MTWNRQPRSRPRRLLPGDRRARRPLRRAAVYRRQDDRHLLPPDLSRPARRGRRTSSSSPPRQRRTRPASGPCLRCRPETSPDLGAWRGASNTVSRALALVEMGALDEASVDALASRVGVGERQLRRLFQQHLGASPIAVAQSRRVLLAKQLIHETRLPMTEIAMAAGFGSLRRFNDTFQALFKRPPTALRRSAGYGCVGRPQRRDQPEAALPAARMTGPPCSVSCAPARSPGWRAWRATPTGGPSDWTGSKAP